VALLTDFGLSDHYVGVVKGVIKGIAPLADILDLTHDVTPFDIVEGAFLLLRAAPYLPLGCAVVAVVDPGVATKRRPLAVATKKRVYLGPDNGLLYPAASSEGILAIHEITNPRFVLSLDGTFAGRDVFAPAAAHILKGVKLEDLGPARRAMKKLAWPSVRVGPGRIEGVVLHVDRFGNVVTNVDAATFDGWRSGRTKFRLLGLGFSGPVSLAHSYEEMKGLGLIVGSGGTLEVSSRRRAVDVPLKKGSSFVLSFT
jgi:S-adenosylmethionine hydrolase